nr:hypothetical protein [Tanacetum cinerariifolium]
MFFDHPRPSDKNVSGMEIERDELDVVFWIRSLGVSENGVEVSGVVLSNTQIVFDRCFVSQADVEDSSRGVVFFVYFGSGIWLIKRDCKENSNIFSQGIAFAITSYYILIEQGSPKEDLCMIAFQPQRVSVWEGAEAVLLQAEETKLEYSSRSLKIFSRILDFIRIIVIFLLLVGNIVTNSRETPSWREIVSLTVLVKLASFT